MNQPNLRHCLKVRPLGPDDSLEELTALLHRAYAGHAKAGRRYMATKQSVADTRRRIAGGQCFVAEMDGRVVGTFCLAAPESSGGLIWYTQPGVAKAWQIAVDSDLQGQGIGSALLEHLEQQARKMGAVELGLDTSEKATQLVQMYRKRGYRIVDRTYWANTNYRSVVMSKRLCGGTEITLPRLYLWRARQRAHLRQLWHRLQAVMGLAS